MIEAATATLDRNWRDGYTLPSPNLYPFQWNWDAGFIALGLAHVRPERAIAEIRCLFRGQWGNGMVPHIVFHRPADNYFPGPDVWGTDAVPFRPAGVRTSGITQPPVFAFIVERISALPLGLTPEWAAFRREIFPALVAQHRHLYRHRDPLGEGLVYIQHNWEAGTDNSPVYDAALEAIDLTHARDVSSLRRDNRKVAAAHRPTDASYRRYLALVDLFNACGYRDAEIAERSPFLIQDVLFNCVLARSNRSLLALARAVNAEAGLVAEIERWCEHLRRHQREVLGRATGLLFPLRPAGRAPDPDQDLVRFPPAVRPGLRCRTAARAGPAPHLLVRPRHRLAAVPLGGHGRAHLRPGAVLARSRVGERELDAPPRVAPVRAGRPSRAGARGHVARDGCRGPLGIL
jgi:hypothetical protein